MHIAIIGAGQVGSALAEALARSGHRIHLGVREAARTAGLVARSSGQISAHSVAEASAAAEVLIVAAVPAAVPELCAQFGELGSRVIIDAMNTLGPQTGPYATTTEALRVLTGSPDVVKCFNTTGFENMRDPRYGDQSLDMFMAGDSERGKALARQLALDAGFGACHDLGGDSQVPLLESLARVWIQLAIVQKQGRNIGFRLLRR